MPRNQPYPVPPAARSAHPCSKPSARAAFLTATLLGGACSVFPTASKPASVVEAVRVEYAFASDAPRTIEVPASGTDVTVLELVVEPAPRGERFEGGHRILLLPHDCERAHLHCRVRRWARPDADPLESGASADLFPGARSVSFLDEPQP